jgi:outer membrane protein OmpA-like peptidoglycan-associated protein
MTVGTPDVEQLRRLLFGKDYDDLLALKEQFQRSDKYSASVAGIISEALRLRSTQDDSLSEALEPTVEQALTRSISRNPKGIADMLYPVMGPAIRKSINQALNEALENLNRLLENSLSLRSWKWRFDAWRTGQSYARIALLRTLVYQVEQVFLIHRQTGLLLQHVESPNAISKDPAMVSGMLTAIQDFIADSFHVDQNNTLRTLNLGDVTVLIEHGPQAVLAMVVRGNVPSEELHELLLETSAAIHSQYAAALKAFQGDAEPFANAGTLLSDCLKSRQASQPQHSPWLAWLLLGGIAAGLAYWGFLAWQAQQQRLQQEAMEKLTQQQALQTLNQRLQELQTHTSDLQDTLQTLTVQQREQLEQQRQQALKLAQNEQTISDLTHRIESSTYPFELGKADADPSQPGLVQLGEDIQALLRATNLAGKTLQVIIVGNADDSGGSESFNRKLAQQRASNLMDALTRNGVPVFMLAAYSINGPEQASTLLKNERSTRYQVRLY